MNKVNYYICGFLCTALILSHSKTVSAEPLAVEGKAGIFIPSSSKIRKIFGTASPFVEVEAHYRFFPDWEAWVGVGYIDAYGTSLGCGSSTKINMVPFTLGIKRFFSLSSKVKGFLGVGALWTLYRNRDDSESVHQHISDNAFGGIATAGFQFNLNDRFALRLCGEYMYQYFTFHKVYKKHFTYRHNVNMSGTKIGLGLLYSF